jgi:hypothetical protein
MSKYTVKNAKYVRWSIWLDDKLIEGGFFSKEAAEAYLEKEYQS